ncbi:MAG: prohibitin family protein, partial [Clostridia bacterium]|nr:prohibitin family protein [Clostridia bacterium]
NNSYYTDKTKKAPVTDYRKSWKIIMWVVIAIVGLIIVLNCLTSVPTGYSGIVTTFGKVENNILDAGLHLKLPWQKVVKMDNRNQKGTLELIAFSKDIQEVAVSYSINYQIEKANAQNIYKSVGVRYYETIMIPRIEEAVKSNIAKYTAETLIESRTTLSDEIFKILKADLSTYNIEVISTAIENIDFSDAFTNAVEMKQVAAQNKLRAQIEQEQANIEQEAKAKRAIIEAQAAADTAKIAAEADLEVTKIQADAAEYAGQKDAAINKAIGETMTPDLLQYYYIKQWDGKLPATYISQEDFNSLFEVALSGETAGE